MPVCSTRRPRNPFMQLCLTLCGLFILIGNSSAQPAIAVDEAVMREVMPDAERFEAKAGDPPVYRASATDDNGNDTLIGYLFETTDLPPQEVGYSAPIEMLVGMDLQGNISGMKVLYYRESYKSIRGDFINTERFPNQFEGMSLSDGFRVGRDIDGISRATITSWAVSRGIRNAARRVARSYLTDSDFVQNANSDAVALEYLSPLSWDDMLENGMVKQITITQPDGTELILAYAFMGHEGLGELLVGADDYSRADREASNRIEDGHLMLVGIDGDATNPFRQEKLAIEQDGILRPSPRRQFVYVGSADTAKIADRVRFAGAMVLGADVDLTRPFTIHYDTDSEMGRFENLASVEYQVAPIPLALATGTPLPPELFDADEDGFGEYAEEGVWASLVNNAPWPAVIALLVLLTLVMTAFLTKRESIRWAALAGTLIYLGFIDGGFVSVSHITNGIKLGPGMFLTDLPTLLIISFTLITTIIWGRVFCSSLCPFGALQDFISRFLPRHFQKNLPAAFHDKAIYIKYAILGFLIVMALAYSELSLFQYFEPFGTLFYQSQSVVLWLILAAFMIGIVFIKRFYCRYVCPLGAALGVISLVSPFRIKRVAQCEVCTHCEHACPTGAIKAEKIDFKECVRCDICESKLIARSGVCKHPVEEVQSRLKDWQPVTVS